MAIQRGYIVPENVIIYVGIELETFNRINIKQLSGFFPLSRRLTMSGSLEFCANRESGQEGTGPRATQTRCRLLQAHS